MRAGHRLAQGGSSGGAPFVSPARKRWQSGGTRKESCARATASSKAGAPEERYSLAPVRKLWQSGGTRKESCARATASSKAGAPEERHSLAQRVSAGRAAGQERNHARGPPPRPRRELRRSAIR